MWAVVLGGSSGFGLATVEKLAGHGMNLAVLYRETAMAERSLKERLSLLGLQCGVTILPFNSNALDERGRLSFMEQFRLIVGERPCVRLLLHSIARGNLKPLATPAGSDGKDSDQEGGGRTGDSSRKREQEVLSIGDIDLTTYAMSTSLLDWVRALLKEEFFHPDARVIGLTSEGAHKYWEGYAAVSIAKASLESLATYMAVEFGKYGLKTNLVQAGITETPSLKKIPGSEKLVELSNARNPLGRMTRPEDVANVIYLLCTDEASWINGSVIHVDGGEHCL